MRQSRIRIAQPLYSIIFIVQVDNREAISMARSLKRNFNQEMLDFDWFETFEFLINF